MFGLRHIFTVMQLVRSASSLASFLIPLDSKTVHSAVCDMPTCSRCESVDLQFRTFKPAINYYISMSFGMHSLGSLSANRVWGRRAAVCQSTAGSL